MRRLPWLETQLVVLFLLLCGACTRKSGGQETAEIPDGIELVSAPAGGDVASLVRDQLSIADRDHRRLVVYVSASWCEPCKHFQNAVESGQLDVEFGDLRLLKFDFDRDEARLRKAGYRSEMIPLFAIPEPSGRGGDRMMSGSIKGPGAVDNIRPRLHRLLGDS